MSYCLNPRCENPQNTNDSQFCLSCGTKLFLKHRYRAMKLIGQGGFGRTLLAVDESQPLKPPCVIKQFLLTAQGTDNTQKAAELFEQEALRLNDLGRHNQIPNLLDYLIQEEHQYLVQEYIDGYDLSEILKEQGVFKEEQIWELLNSLLPVLEFIHSRDVIHRDIKPENIIRSRDGKLYLVDFGAAKVVTGTAILQTGTSIGTPEFVAPEQSRGKAIYSSDLYSLGTTCIYLLTGVSPFDLFDISEYKWVWRQYLVDNPVSDKLSNILDKLIENATSRRYQSVSEVLKDINYQSNSTSGNTQSANYQTPKKIPNSTQTKTANYSFNYQTPKKTSNPAKVKPVNYSSNSQTPIKTPNSPQKPGNYRSFQCINTLTGHSGSINSIAISPDGKIFASSDDSQIILRSVRTGAIKLRIDNESGVSALACISINTTSQRFEGILVSCDLDNNIHFWDVSSRQKIRTLKEHKNWLAKINYLNFNPDGSIIAAAVSDKTIKLWNLSTGSEILTLENHDTSILHSISVDGNFIVGASCDGKVILWDLSSGKIINVINAYTIINSVAFSPSQGIIATGEDYNIKLWKISSGEKNPISNTDDFATYVTLNPNGKIFSIGSNSKEIRFDDTNTKQKESTLCGHLGKVNSLVFSPDGKNLYSGSDDSTIKIWQYR